jgi:hypothetical protein
VKVLYVIGISTHFISFSVFFGIVPGGIS